MADPEMPTTNDTPAPPAPPESAPQDPLAAAIQEKGPADSPPPSAITGEEPAAPEPEAKPPRRPVPLVGRVRVLDRVLVGLVLVLAFFLGAFTIGNADFWMHLETGKRLSHGDATLGADPFSYTTANVTWVNHAWLFDWLMYNLYEVAGPVGLVVLRGLVLAGLALVLMRIREPGQSLWLPAVCTTLALLTVSSRLPFQPLIVSYLFFGLTLYLIHRALHGGGAFTLRGRSVSPLWLLPPLFALWVNLDAWFLLGPLTVALFLVGAGVQRLTASAQVAARGPVVSTADVRTLGLVLVVGLAACLVNPYLHRAFTLPLDLAYPFADVLPEWMVTVGVSAHQLLAAMPLSRPDISPFNDLYWADAGVGWNVAGMAYFPLLLLGLVSFALVVGLPHGDLWARRFPAGWLLAWAPLVVLSVFNFRLMGFFAIVAAPAVALNFQELSRRRPAGELTWGQWNWAIAGRLVTALGCVVLLLLAWPGRLHGNPDSPRYSHRVRFEIYTDASLESAARHLDEVLATGKLRNGFNLSADVADYFAWFSPGARTYYDGRFILPPQAAREFAEVRKALRDEAAAFSGRRPIPDAERGLGAVERFFRAHDINYLVLTSLQDPEALEVANRLTLDPRRWARLYNDGRTAVFGWRDPARPGDPFAGLEPDYNKMAYGKVPQDRRAPPQAPAPLDGPPNLWQRFVYGKPATPLAASEARSFLNDYGMFTPKSPRWWLPIYRTTQLLGALGAPGTAAVGPAELPATGSALLSWTPPYRRSFSLAMMANSPGPPALPVLAVRTARRAAAEDAASAESYYTLADAFWVLWREQERHWDYMNPDPKVPLDLRMGLTRQTMRHVQYVTALNQASRLEPENVAMLHLRLFDIFMEMGYVDVALDHLEKAREHFPSMRPRRGFEKEKEELGKRLEDHVRNLTEEVQRRKEEYEQHAYGQRSLAKKVDIALFKKTRLPGKGAQQVDRGLAKLALKLMGEADLKALPKEEQPLIVDLQIRLNLFLGRTWELRKDVFDAEGKQALRPVLGPRYDDYAILYAAALGNYHEADELLAARELDPLQATKLSRRLHDLAKQLQAVGEAGKRMLVLSLWTLPTAGVRFDWAALAAAEVRARAMGAEFGKARAFVQGTAEVRALRGLLALEQGENARAVEQFRGCRDLAGPLGDLFPSQPLVLRYLRLLEKYW
jgi:hypothetical protein